jgi:sugar phosphate isomerase/epimerase
MNKFRYSFIAGTLGQTSDRYLKTGYKEKVLTPVQVLERMASYNKAEGVELHYRGNETKNDIEQTKAILKKLNLKIAYVNAWLYGERKWMFGSLSAPDSKTRKSAMEEIYKLVDHTRKIGGEGIGLWLGQDGFDYAFQTDYRSQWQHLISALKEICEYASGMKIALEPKTREPRNRLLIDSVPTSLLACIEAGNENLGITVDMGHVLQDSRNIAQSLDMAIKYGRLFNVHANDNYAAWDDDMIVGSVHLMEFLEAFYILKKYEYDGWIAVDIFPYREDPFEATAESISYMESYSRVIDMLGIDKIDSLIKNNNVTETMKAFRETIFRI